MPIIVIVAVTILNISLKSCSRIRSGIKRRDTALHSTLKFSRACMTPFCSIEHLQL